MSPINPHEGNSSARAGEAHRGVECGQFWEVSGNADDETRRLGRSAAVWNPGFAHSIVVTRSLSESKATIVQRLLESVTTAPCRPGADGVDVCFGEGLLTCPIGRLSPVTIARGSHTDESIMRLSRR